MTDFTLRVPPSTDWSHMSHDEQQRALFNKQKDLLDTFLSRGAIDRRQYEKSLTCMAEKMGMREVGANSKTFDQDPSGKGAACPQKRKTQRRVGS